MSPTNISGSVACWHERTWPTGFTWAPDRSYASTMSATALVIKGPESTTSQQKAQALYASPGQSPSTNCAWQLVIGCFYIEKHTDPIM